MASSSTEAEHKYVMPVGISQCSHARLEAEICQFLGHNRKPKNKSRLAYFSALAPDSSRVEEFESIKNNPVAIAIDSGCA